MNKSLIKALFLDVGGVLMTNGWDRHLRQKVIQEFDLEGDEVQERHGLIFDTFETGKISFDEYLERTIFFKERSFSLTDVKEYVLGSARPFQDMIDYVKELKRAHGLKVGVVSNEGRELAVDRIQRFDLPSFVDFFVVSSFVHFRKPDPDIYRLALDCVQVPPSQIVYLDDRPLLVEVAKRLGIQGVHHQGLEKTQESLEALFGLAAHP